MVLLQSSKSSAWDAVPLISAASSRLARRSLPKTTQGPAPAPAPVTVSTIAMVSSRDPARATPTVSSIPILAQ